MIELEELTSSEKRERERYLNAEYLVQKTVRNREIERQNDNCK